jgi:predicted DNA-binding antitoxin AbrB/MazE fold protein
MTRHYKSLLPLLKGGIFMQAIEAIYNGTNFKPMQPIPVKGSYKVVITFIEPVKNDMDEVKKLPRSGFFGILKGKVWMSDDFNEPLEEMKEYME